MIKNKVDLASFWPFEKHFWELPQTQKSIKSVGITDSSSTDLSGSGDI